MQKYLSLFFLITISLIFFRPVFMSARLPIPADTIVGLYHPFRDLYAKDYPNGIPFKNFLITDPVRQQYPWRYLSINLEKKFQLPLWNPYNFSGTPHLANFQSASLYPLNIVFLFMSFNYGWTLLIILQPLLGSIFMYLYLRFLKLERASAFLGGFVFAFSGSSIAWMQWNIIFNVLLWLPLILLAKERLLQKFSKKWIFIYIFAQICSILAGHLQILFYSIIISNVYLFIRFWQLKSSGKKIIYFCFLNIIILLIVLFQLISTFQFILLSARDLDQAFGRNGWFVPFQNIVQFFIPDFFGNPATLNYWGEWNYAEFIGYIGIIPLIMSLYGIMYRRDNKVLFFTFIFLISLIFSIDNLIARIPYILNIPFISTSQPTRLILIADFALAILSALGFDYWLKKKKSINTSIVIFIIIFVSIWISVYSNQINVSKELLDITKRNLLFPSIIFILSSFFLFINQLYKNKVINKVIIVLLILITFFDIFRLADKFLPFISNKYIFPSTKTIEFLQKNAGNYRIMSLDNRILPPNFSIMYKLQTVDGYDPLYLRRYGELISASERGEPNISPPFGFNRIITPKNYDSRIIDMIGVKYILSLSDIISPKLRKVFQEGQTRVYENRNVFPRAYIVQSFFLTNSRQDSINALFDKNNTNLNNMIIIEKNMLTDNKRFNNHIKLSTNNGKVKITEYAANKIVIKTENSGNFYLILTDSYYPTWKVKIDENNAKIELANYNFRGVLIPDGKHTVVFYNTLL